MQADPRNLSAVREPRDWAPDSWQRKPAVQQPSYPDANALAAALAQLHALPPLVTSWEVLALKRKLADAAEGRCFLLQGGDCAESFADCTSPIISNRLKVLLQMSLVLVHGLKLPVVRVGRFAGQYAKPRSADAETHDGETLPSYRGDIVNAPEFNAAARRPDPQRLIEAHSKSALTMNFTRALIEDGRANRVLDGTITTGCPVHILQGMRDPDVPYTHALRLMEHLPSDDVVMTLIRDGDHRLSREEDIAKMKQAIGTMLA